MKAVRFIVLLLMVIGSLNWGLIGFFHYDLVGDLFGGMYAGFSRFIFAIVGLAGLCGIAMLCRCCKGCKCGPHCGCDTKKGH